MNWKRLSAAALAGALTLSGAALAAGEQPIARGAALGSAGLPEGAAWYGLSRPELISAPIPARYAATVTVNGKELEPVTFYNVDPVTYEETEVTMSVADLPGCPGGYVPMRLLCGADPKGYSDWIASEDSAVFSFHKNSLIVDFSDLSVTLEGEKVEGVQAYLDPNGVTFLPVSFLATLPGVEVDDHLEMDTEHYDFTLVVSPLTALADSIKEQAGAVASFELSADDLALAYEIPADAIEELIAYGPMMTSPDTVFIVKVPADKQADVVKGFESYIQRQVDTFSWYLTQHLEKAQNGKIATQGDYVMLFIGEDAAKAVELFEAGVKELEK